jgi:ammonium transporter, Amt family
VLTFYLQGGAIAGNGIQMGYQMAGACFIIGWNLVWTTLILLFIKHVLRIPLRMSEEQLLLGDDAVHGEEAYVFGPCEAHDPESGYIQGEVVREPTDNDGELGLGGRSHYDRRAPEVTGEKLASERSKNGESPSGE